MKWIVAALLLASLALITANVAVTIAAIIAAGMSAP